MTTTTASEATPALVCRALVRSAALAASLLIAWPGAEPLAAAAPGAEPPANIAAELSGADVARYGHIFSLQETGQWAAADAVIDATENPILMGHVQFQRYMHPTDYRSRFSELSHWLEHYRDLPGADRIYRLALRRQGSAAAPLPPTRPYTNGAANLGGSPAAAGSTVSAPRYRSPNPRTAYEARKVREAFAYVRAHLRVLEVDHANGDLLKGVTINSVFDPVEKDILRGIIATGYFNTGRDAMALELLDAVAENSRKYIPDADWIAGLAAWNLGEFDHALGHFEAYAGAAGINERRRAAAAFWAARASLVTGQPEKVNPWLRQAADLPYTFYGVLAARQLGYPVGLTFEGPPISEAEADVLKGVPAIRRAIALTQIGDDYMADREIKAVYGAAGFGISQPLLAVASRYGMAAAQLRIGREVLAFAGEAFNDSLFPVPNWQLDGGFDMDRALILALVRQESAFNIRARSVDGATGLMQLMPSTARFVSGDDSLRGKNADKLFAPEFNLTLGQQYLKILMESDGVGPNLIRMVAAYNGGPGNLSLWTRIMGPVSDPLVFMEKIPIRETREFVELVLTNLWIYRARLGQESPGLDALAVGEWPQYHSAESSRQTVLNNARN